MMKIQELWSMRLLRLLLVIMMTLAAVNLCGSFLDISNQFKLYRNVFKDKTLELTTFRREKLKQFPFETKGPVLTKTITQYTVPIKHSPNITQHIESTTQKTNSNRTHVRVAHNIETQQTQRTLHHNTATQSSAQNMEIILDSNMVFQSPTQSKHHQIQHRKSPIKTQNTLNAKTQKNANTTETTRQAISNEDGEINISATMESISNENVTTPMPYCKRPSGLGPVSANKSKVELSWVETLYPEVERGGMYSPSNCTAMHSVAIFVPYRDREEHLAIFLRHIHPFLMKQQLEYGIYVIEQLGNSDFNKGILYNAVFLEVQGLSPAGWDCFVFQDIDLLPLDLRNLYSCPINPRHMSVAVDTLDNRYQTNSIEGVTLPWDLEGKLMYRNMFGGVTILSAAQFLEVNGYSNMYWGWGGEDDDMSIRLRHRGYIIGRTNASIARYTMLPHKRRRPNPNRIRILRQAINNYLHDGLSNVKYDLVNIVTHHLYTLIQVDVDRYANDTFIVESTTVLPNVTKDVTKNTTTISTSTT